MMNKIVLFFAIFALAKVDARKINNDGLAMIKQLEGFRADFYFDSAGIKTIGYGHACHANNCANIKAPITESKASQLLTSELVKFERCVNNFASGLNDDQFAALVSFTYNLGCASLTNTKDSTIGRKVAAGEYSEAAGQFGRWVNVTKGGKKVKVDGLVNRRNAERARFCRSGGC